MDENEFELAQQRQEQQIEQALARRVQYIGESLAHCEECECAIPLLRREAVPGVRLCIDCQEIREVRRG